MRKLKTFIIQAFKDWIHDNALRNSAALSFYIILALPALILSLLSLSGFFLGPESAEHEITKYAAAALGSSGEEIIATITPDDASDSGFNLKKILGLIVLAISASGIFGQLQTSLNEIWNLELKPKHGLAGLKRTAINKGLLFLMLLVFSGLLLASLILESILAFGSDIITNFISLPSGLTQTLSLGISFILLTFIVALVYKYLPDAKIRWADAGVGAVITALLITIGKFGIGWYLGRASLGSVYGAAGSLVILLASIYYSTLVFFLGAEVTQNYANMYGSGIKPNLHARSSGTWKTFFLGKLRR